MSTIATRCDHEPVWTPAEPKPGTPLVPQFPEPKQDKPCCADDPLKVQVDGNHYKKLGDYQPWKVLQQWLTEEEFRGYMKGTAIAYICREDSKGGSVDIEKAIHTLQGLLALER
jgi:hypothetical protein